MKKAHKKIVSILLAAVSAACVSACSCKPAQQNYGEYLDSSMKKFYLQVITGGASISGWNDFVADYNKNGGEAVLKQVNQWYKA